MIFKLFLVILLLYFKYINGLLVLRSQSPLKASNFAAIRNSSLFLLDRFTICARFFPYQFQDTFHYMQDIISTGSKETTIFGTVTTGNCNKGYYGFDGCSEFLKRNIADKWKYGKAFGRFSDSKFMGVLKPEQWYGMCIIIDVMLSCYVP